MAAPAVTCPHCGRARRIAYKSGEAVGWQPCDHGLGRATIDAYRRATVTSDELQRALTGGAFSPTNGPTPAVDPSAGVDSLDTE